MNMLVFSERTNAEVTELEPVSLVISKGRVRWFDQMLDIRMAFVHFRSSE